MGVRPTWVQEVLVPRVFDGCTRLCLLMRQEGSDKSTFHNYTAVYHTLFARLSDSPVRLFELGIGTNNTSFPSNMGADGVPGASLRAWARYFPQGQIYGGDIDRDILFSDETARIHTYYCDQTRPADVETALAAAGGDFDIIIDDGLHTWAANLAFFEAAAPFLRPHGVFIIEDLLPATAAAAIVHMDDIMRKHRLSYGCVLELPHPYNTNDNRLAIFARDAPS